MVSPVLISIFRLIFRCWQARVQDNKISWVNALIGVIQIKDSLFLKVSWCFTQCSRKGKKTEYVLPLPVGALINPDWPVRKLSHTSSWKGSNFQPLEENQASVFFRISVFLFFLLRVVKMEAWSTYHNQKVLTNKIRNGYDSIAQHNRNRAMTILQHC